jgi:hypothetical protein
LAFYLHRVARSGYRKIVSGRLHIHGLGFGQTSHLPLCRHPYIDFIRLPERMFKIHRVSPIRVLEYMLFRAAE